MSKVTLVSHTADPLETMYITWLSSRSSKPVPKPSDLKFFLQKRFFAEPGTTHIMNQLEGFGFSSIAELRESFNSTVTMLLEEDVPVMDCIWFNFLLEDVPVSLREQIVRHRMGTQSSSEYLNGDFTVWVQSMRQLNMADFEYFTPTSIRDEENAETEYDNLMVHIRHTYQRLVDLHGIPPEDARHVIPLGATHRLAWTLNLKAIKHILSKRSCYVAQIELWQPIVEGISQAMQQINKRFKILANPPCIRGTNEWVGCPFRLINEDRIRGVDPFEPCPLYLKAEGREEDYLGKPPAERQQQFENLWGRSVTFLSQRIPPHQK